jgi:hypothetical protein
MLYQNNNKMLNTYLFPAEYFAGNDVYISINNTPIDEVVDLEFQLTEQKVPIYGYASHTWDAIATGTRAVVGRFTINFKETQYINNILNEAIVNGGIIYPEKTDADTGTRFFNLTDEELIKWIKGKTLNEIKHVSEKYFDRLFKEPTKLAKSKQYQPFFNTPDQKLNIIILYGEALINLGQSYDAFPGTIKVLNSIHITGCRQVIQPTSNNILEEYTFIGRDINDTIFEEDN